MHRRRDALIAVLPAPTLWMLHREHVSSKELR